MTYTIEQMSADCRDALKKDSGPGGREIVRQCVERACQDPEFVATHFGPDNDSQRKILYEDPELGFCILAHVYKGARASNPHDHGPSWAIYGQAKGVTVMTDWRKIEAPENGKPGTVEKVKSYELRPGMAYVYQEGDLHSPMREDDTSLVRIEGINMEGVKRDAYKAA